jgi:ribonucleoside-triphosphate reductase (thioredoxin)
LTQLLTDDFISQYPEFPSNMNPLGQFVFYRTYSRFLPNLGRRETWKETVRRAVEYNVQLGVKHLDKIGYDNRIDEHRKEAEELFDNMFNLRQFLSGRTLWTGGSLAAELSPLSNFNCSFTNVSSWNDLADIFYLLMVGTGCGFKCTKEMAAKLPPIRTNTTLLHSDYSPVPKAARYENTILRDMENGYAKIYIGDSKMGWVDSLRIYLDILTKPEYKHIHTVKVSYNSVRPKGERLKIFGGTASGPEPLREMFEGVDRVLKNEIDPSLAPIETDENGYGKVRPIHILDIGNLIGANVVVGGKPYASDVNKNSSLSVKLPA